MAFFWLALRALTFGVFRVFYMNYNKEAKSLSFRRGSEVSQGRSWDLDVGFRNDLQPMSDALNYLFALNPINPNP